MAFMNLTSTTGSGFLETDFDQMKDGLQDGTLDLNSSGFFLGGTSINTLGTLTNVAYKAQNNNFTTSQSVTGNIDYSGQGYGVTQTLTDAANIPWNLDSGDSAVVTLGGARTLDNPTNMKNGGTYVLKVITGAHSLAYGSAYKWAGGTAPTVAGTSILSFWSDGTNMYGTSVLDLS